MKPFVLSVCGGSGAGKSTLAFGLQDTYPDKVMIFHIDDYFKPESEVPKLHGMTNWDSPAALFSNKMTHDLKALKDGKSVVINTKSPRLNPNFLKTGKRIPVSFQPKPLIIVEGFLALHFKKLRELYDLSIYLEAPFELHAARRVHGKLHNFPPDYDELVLKPMHEQYVFPNKQFADASIDITGKTPEMVFQEAEVELQNKAPKLMVQLDKK